MWCATGEASKKAELTRKKLAELKSWRPGTVTEAAEVVPESAERACLYLMTATPTCPGGAWQ